MKKFIAIILVLTMLLTLCACGAQTDMSAATTEATVPGTETTTADPTAEVTATETAENAEEADNTILCNLEDLHPLYQELGFPNAAVKYWISAKEVEPIILPTYPLGEWAKCVYTGYTIIDDIFRGFDLYLYFSNGEIGTWIVTDLGYSMAFPGYVPENLGQKYDCPSNTDYITLSHFGCDRENCCEYIIYPRLDRFTVYSAACGKLYRHSGFYVTDSHFYDMALEVPATIYNKRPYSSSKCIYTGTSTRQNGEERFSVSIDIYCYVNDGIAFNYIADNFGSTLEFGSATLVSGNGCRVEFSPAPGYKTIYVERTDFGFLIG